MPCIYKMIHNTSAECLPITIYTCKHGLVLFHFVENMLGGIQLNWALRFVFRESYHPSELNYRIKFPFYLVYIYLIYTTGKRALFHSSQIHIHKQKEIYFIEKIYSKFRPYSAASNWA